MPVWIMSEKGDLLFYNEEAESIVGRRFNEAGEIRAEDLADLFQTTDDEGQPIPSSRLPISVALVERRAVHMQVRIRGLDGVWRRISVTSFPIEGKDARLLGAVALLWEDHQ
jgi:PAS domain-containing protein